MPLRINQNITALTAWRNLTITDWRLAKSIERLSSGLRINRASDDPAGYITSERMRAQIEGMTQALANVVDSISMIQTVEGAFDEIEALLRSMRALALHAANTGPNDPEAIENDQIQIQNALDSIRNIAITRKFGGKVMLDGGLGKRGYVSGLTIPTAFIQREVSFDFKSAGIDTIIADDIGVRFAGGTYRGTILTSITRLPRQWYVRAAEIFADGTGSIVRDEILTINGVNIQLEAGMNAIEVREKINSYVSQTGVSAGVWRTDTNTFAGNVPPPAANTQLRLFSKNFGAEWKIDVLSNLPNTEPRTTGFGAPAVVLSSGVDIGGVFRIIYATAHALNANGISTISIPAAGKGTVLYPTDLTFNVNIFGKGWTEVTLKELNVILQGRFRNWYRPVGTLTFAPADLPRFLIDLRTSPIQFQIGPNRGEVVRFGINNMRPEALGLTGRLSDIDVRSMIGAERAIQIIDEALDQVLAMRGQVGAFQKHFLESTKGNLMVYRENYMAAESHIRDTDMAAEMVQFTRHQILMQSATAMLAQANLAPQAILTLLR